jgi:hypothetical protein
MSKVLEYGTEFSDIHIIREALEQQGFTAVFNPDYTVRTMHGFQGQTFLANLGVTRANFTQVTGLHTYGDLGFALKADRSIDFIADDMLIESKAFTKVFDGIKSAYAERRYIQEMYQGGFALETREVTETGEVALEFARMGAL